MKAVHVSLNDNVATAIEELRKGEVVLDTTIMEDIPKGHKFSTAYIKKGYPIIKYDAHIGIASSDIPKGSWVHIHNIEGERGRGDTDTTVRDIEQSTKREIEVAKSDKKYVLRGYRRADGKFGLRNHVLVIPSVHCANKVVEEIIRTIDVPIAKEKSDTRPVFITHQHGCSELSYDAEQTESVLAGTGANPNVYAVLVVGLGCEVIQAEHLAKRILELAPYKKVEFFNIQDMGGTKSSIKRGREIVLGLLKEAKRLNKSEGTLADIVLGTECGGSDSFSGLTGNPSLGVVSDIVVEQDGSVILAETTELIGAEHILAQRAATPEIADKVINTIKGYEQTVIDSHADIRGANPSPGNIKGGLSSIEEKSLGCIYKAGNTPVVAVKEYAEQITDKGLTLMNTPGNDIEQLSGMVAGGCNVCVFTTGRGTPTGSPITPTIKVATNSLLYERMKEDMDINAGGIIDHGKSKVDVGREILELMVQLGEGKLTKAESNEQNDFSIWRLATTV